MYLNHFGLQKEPFHITPDPYFFFLSPSHKEAFASMIYALKNRKGFICVTGEVGLGKTTVLRSFLDKKEQWSKIKTIFVFNPNVSFKGLLKIIYAELGLELPSEVKQYESRGLTETHSREEQDDITFSLIQELHSQLIREYQNGFNIVLVIDEAQNIPVKTLENLRMLSNLETSKDKLLQIFLIGQPELDKKLNLKELRQLKQRLAVKVVLKPLSRRQAREYINYRLAKAGASKGQKLFTKGAVRKLSSYSKGIPRKINIIADNALITGFGYDKNQINSKIIKEAQADLEGKSRNRLKKPVLISSTVLIIIGLGLWFSPYKKPLLTGVNKVPGLNGLASGWSGDSKSLTDKNNLQERQELTAHQASNGTLETNRTAREKEYRETKYYIGKKGQLVETKQSSDNSSLTAVSEIFGVGYDKSKLFKNSTKKKEKQLVKKDYYSDDNVSKIDKKGKTSHQILLSNTSPKTFQKEDLALFDPEEKRIYQELSQKLQVFNKLQPVRKRVLVEMAKQTSVEGLLTFKRMIQALEEKDFQEASRQMVYSHWCRRVGQRAHELAEVMKKGGE